MIVSKFEPVEVRTTDGWFVRLLRNGWDDMVQIWIGHSAPHKHTICSFDKNGRLMESEVKEGAVDIKPTLELNGLIWESLSRVLQGVAQPPEKSHIEGELQATKYHMEDLRKLLKLV